MRARISAVPPAPDETTIRIGWVGQFSAAASTGTNRTASATNTHRKVIGATSFRYNSADASVFPRPERRAQRLLVDLAIEEPRQRVDKLDRARFLVARDQ